MQPPMGTKPDASTQELPAANTELSAAATRAMPPVPPPANGDARPPAPMVVGPQGDSCPSCGATMAADQRYCVECGNRRGEPRLPVMDGRTAAEAQPVAPPPGGYPPPPAPRSKWSSSIALITGIGVLLLAMGVGVLIGHNGNSKNATAQQPVIIGGAATAATGAATATGASAATSTAKSKGASASSDGTDASSTAKANGVKLAPSDVKVGDKCSKGTAGCSSSGTFNGSFFK